MAKKSFKGGFDSLLGENALEKNNNPQKKKPQKNEIRATFIVDKEKYEKLKGISFWNRVMIKESLDKALGDFIKDYERTNGGVTLPQPKE